MQGRHHSLWAYCEPERTTEWTIGLGRHLISLTELACDLASRKSPALSIVRSRCAYLTG